MHRVEGEREHKHMKTERTHKREGFASGGSHSLFTRHICQRMCTNACSLVFVASQSPLAHLQTHANARGRTFFRCARALLVAAHGGARVRVDCSLSLTQRRACSHLRVRRVRRIQLFQAPALVTTYMAYQYSIQKPRVLSATQTREHVTHTGTKATSASTSTSACLRDGGRRRRLGGVCAVRARALHDTRARALLTYIRMCVLGVVTLAHTRMHVRVPGSSRFLEQDDDSTSLSASFQLDTRASDKRKMPGSASAVTTAAAALLASSKLLSKAATKKTDRLSSSSKTKKPKDKSTSSNTASKKSKSAARASSVYDSDDNEEPPPSYSASQRAGLECVCLSICLPECG